MFADIHCHLCPGLDDGPDSLESALAMIHQAFNEGIRFFGCVAHQNEAYPAVTPDRILAAATQLDGHLEAMRLPIELFPLAEVMIAEDTVDRWHRGELLSVNDDGNYLLMEYPQDVYVDIRDAVWELTEAGIRPILAHAERLPELLHFRGIVEELIELGCIVQVNTDSLIDPVSHRDERALRDWIRRGIVHVVGTDAHGPGHRPRMLAAYERLSSWAGPRVARRLCHAHAMSIFRGEPLMVPRPEPAAKRSWFSRS
jgi:protein-tyrosine phosphatase